MAEIRESPIAKRQRIAIRLRAFQAFYLMLVCFFVATGELFTLFGFRVGRKVHVMLYLPLLLAVVIAAIEKRLGLRVTWREALLFLFIAFTALGIVYSPFPTVVRRELVYVIAAAVFYFLLLHAARSIKDFKMFCAAFLAGSVLTALVGIWNYLRHGSAGTITWSHYNVFGAYLEIPLALCLALTIFFLRRWRILPILILSLIILMLGAYLTHSRGTWLACAIIVILAGILSGRKGFLVAGPIAAAGVIGFLILVPISSLPGGKGGILSKNDSFLESRRYNIWPCAFHLAGKRPLMGYGLNVYRNACEVKYGIEKPHYSEIDDLKLRTQAERRYRHKINYNVHPHSEFLQGWTSMGLMGIFFFIMLPVSVLVTSIRLRQFKPGAFSAAIGIGGFAWYIGHVAHGAFDCFFFFEHAFCAAAIMFALIFGSYYLESTGNSTGSNSDANATG